MSIWNSLRLGAVAVLLNVPMATTAEAQRTDALAYYRQFSDNRIRDLEYDLIWVGETQAVTSGRIGPAQLRAIQRFERSLGTRADGVLRRNERRALRAEADRIRDRVGYRVTIDPGTGARIGIPFALVGRGAPVRGGTRWATEDGSVVLETDSRPLRGSLREAYARAVARPGREVTYKLRRSRFFVVSGREGGRSFYTRARTNGRELRSFTVTYDTRLEGVFDPIIVAMSNDFEAFAAGPARRIVPVPQLREPAEPQALACAPRIRVAYGDTLSRIAARCNTSVSRLRRANSGLDPLDLRAGQTLSIPDANETLPPLPEPPAPVARVQEPETVPPAPQTAASEDRTEPTGFDESGEPPASEREVANVEPTSVEPVYAPTAIFAPLQPVAGRRLTVTATGFPPGTPVELGFSRINASMRAVETARTDSEGRVTFRVPLPDWLEAGQTSAVVIETSDGEIAATTQSFMVRSAPAQTAGTTDEREPLLLSGMTTAEGTGCATMRDMEGRLYNLIGEVADYEPGTAVRVLGFETENGGCGEGPTVEVTNIERRP